MTEPLSYEAIISMIEGRRKLQRIVDANKQSFDCESYRRRRQAALKGWKQRRAAA